MESLTITRITARAVDVPLRKPHPTAGGSVMSAPLVLIDLETDQGITGHAYLFCYTPLVLRPMKELLGIVGDLVLGDPMVPAAMHAKLMAKFRLLGATGLTGMAIAGIDMAAWDAKAKASAMPLARFLGGELRPVPAYHSCGMGGVVGAVADAIETAEAGFSAIKFKVGYGDVSEDLAVIRAAKYVAPDLQIMVDYNQSLDIATAISRAQALDGENLLWIEEPTTSDDYEGHAEIAAAAKTPIQIGENMWGPSDLAKSIAVKASDHIMLDVMKIGGVTGWIRAAALAEKAGLAVSTHLFPEISAQLQCVTQTSHWLEYQDWASPILREPLQVVKGHAIIREFPGSGVEWDEAMVQKFLV